MKTIRQSLTLVIVLIAGTMSYAQTSTGYLHKAEGANISNDYTLIDDALFNSKPFIYPIYTHNFNPGGGSGVYSKAPVTIMYKDAKYRLMTEDGSAFAKTTYWNILIPGSDMSSYFHTVSNDNKFLQSTYIDHPSLNGDSTAIFFVNRINNPGGTGSMTNDKTIGVWYDTGKKQWAIFNQDKSAMVIGVKFSVVIPNKSSEHKTAIVQATKGNTSGHIVTIDLPECNGNPNAKVIITQNWRIGGSTGEYNAHEVGVYYNGTKWAIYNEDKVDIQPNTSFNVMVIKEESASTQDNRIMKIPSLRISPNPISSGDNFQVGLFNEGSETLNIEVIDVTGNVLFTEEITNAPNVVVHDVSTSGFAPGMYMVRVYNTRVAAVRRLIVQ